MLSLVSICCSVLVHGVRHSDDKKDICGHQLNSEACRSFWWQYAFERKQKKTTTQTFHDLFPSVLEGLYELHVLSSLGRTCPEQHLCVKALKFPGSVTVLVSLLCQWLARMEGQLVFAGSELPICLLWLRLQLDWAPDV